MASSTERTEQEVPRFLEAPTVVLKSNSLFAKRAIILCIGMIVASVGLVAIVWQQMAGSTKGQLYLGVALLPTVLLAIMMIFSYRAARDRKPILILTPKGFISSYNNLGTVPWDRVKYLRVSQDSLFPEILISLTDDALRERPSDDAAVQAQSSTGNALSIGIGQIAGTRTEVIAELKPYLKAFANDGSAEDR
ncbi:MAG: hypothetical protein KF784_08795 [Fimbriimonadaceae bacterium]|nr:hypothetical protein [Fimbriimonadaceae bacterium]